MRRLIRFHFEAGERSVWSDEAQLNRHRLNRPGRRGRLVGQWTRYQYGADNSTPELQVVVGPDESGRATASYALAGNSGIFRTRDRRAGPDGLRHLMADGPVRDCRIGNLPFVLASRPRLTY